MPSKESGSVRSSFLRWEEKLCRKPVAGMTTKNLLMQCVPKRMHRIIVTSRNRIWHRSLSRRSGSMRSAVASRNCVRRSWSVTAESTIFRSMMHRSLPEQNIWQIFSRKPRKSVTNRKKYPTGSWAKPCVS